jgi:histone-arginine methyltransferase CARM1
MHTFDFMLLRPEELKEFKVSFLVASKDTCALHGLAGWFEAHFDGSSCDVVLSTSPWDVLTHWWQTRLMLQKPLLVKKDQPISGSVSFKAAGGGRIRTYDVDLVMQAGGVRRAQCGISCHTKITESNTK